MIYPTVEIKISICQENIFSLSYSKGIWEDRTNKFGVNCLTFRIWHMVVKYVSAGIIVHSFVTVFVFPLIYFLSVCYLGFLWILIIIYIETSKYLFDISLPDYDSYTLDYNINLGIKNTISLL